MPLEACVRQECGYHFPPRGNCTDRPQEDTKTKYQGVKHDFEPVKLREENLGVEKARENKCHQRACRTANEGYHDDKVWYEHANQDCGDCEEKTCGSGARHAGAVSCPVQETTAKKPIEWESS